MSQNHRIVHHLLDRGAGPNTQFKLTVDEEEPDQFEPRREVRVNALHAAVWVAHAETVRLPIRRDAHVTTSVSACQPTAVAPSRFQDVVRRVQEHTGLIIENVMLLLLENGTDALWTQKDHDGLLIQCSYVGLARVVQVLASLNSRCERR